MSARTRHGGVDIVFNNAVMRVGPDDDPRAIVDAYTEVNNFGTTRVLRAFAPLLRDNGRLIVVASSFGTLHHLAPVLHNRFDGLVLAGRGGQAGRRVARRGARRQRPRRRLARLHQHPLEDRPGRRRASAGRRAAPRGRARRGILLAAVCPGMINTPTSALWWDVSCAPSPAHAAGPLLELALGPINPEHYGELVRHGQVLPWA